MQHAFKYGILTIHAGSWPQSRQLCNLMSGYLFRGQSDSAWELETSLERAVKREGFSFDRLWPAEAWMIANFRRRAHQFLPGIPKHDAVFDWLAVIQQHGGYTRFLDFTRSFYVAAFFALEDAASDSAIWCVNLDALSIAARQLSHSGDVPLSVAGHDNDAFGEIKRSGGTGDDIILLIEPEFATERLSVQQGVFLAPKNPSTTFSASLVAVLDKLGLTETRTISSKETPDCVPEDVKRSVVIKLVLPRTCHRFAMFDLRTMNITATSLFPGLDGFARSMRFAALLGPPRDGEAIQDVLDLTNFPSSSRVEEGCFTLAAES